MDGGSKSIDFIINSNSIFISSNRLVWLPSVTFKRYGKHKQKIGWVESIEKKII
jgi:hypothetical protein